MSSITVSFAPLSGMALIRQGQSVYWRMTLGESFVALEPAPQMHNLHHDTFHRVETLDDEFPFPLVRTKLEHITMLAQTFDRLIMSLDTEFSLTLRISLAREANKYANEPLVAPFIRELFGRVKLPSQFVLADDVRAVLAVKLAQLVDEAYALWHPTNT